MLFSIMELKDFIYELPKELIAQKPSDVRDMSRLLVLDRSTGSLKEGIFRDVLSYFGKGDVLVLNDTKVIPARIFGKKPTGGNVEVFLLKWEAPSTWKCLVKPGSRLKEGAEVIIDGHRAIIMERTSDGGRIVKFEMEDEKILELGKIPFPPYVHNEKIDPGRYQTVYAKVPGAVAAPTAGLHFTEQLLQELSSRGVSIVKVTLHVGIGTFRPVKTNNIDEHKMEFEWYSVSEEAASIINSAKKTGGSIFACGTTVVRTLESASDKDGLVVPGSGETNLFIKPGYNFKIIDHLITNFHLPGSTLLLLVSALVSREKIFGAYEYAIEKRFRFYSFGDAMLIL